MFDESDIRFNGALFFFEHHIKYVVDFAVKLAKKYGANQEIVVIAAYLHDIGLINSSAQDHQPLGVERSRKMLEEMDYKPEFINAVCDCIGSHSCTTNIPKILEAKVIASADALSHIMTDWFELKFKYTKKTPAEYSEWVKSKAAKDITRIFFENELVLAKKRLTEMTKR